VDGVAAEVLQAESGRLNLARGGNNLFLVAPAEPLHAGREYEFEFRHSGKVIHEAGDHIYYVTSRANWYPANGHRFSNYDLTFHFPRGLDLVSAGDTVDDRIEGDMRVVHRRTSAPVRILGFNLGDYLHAKFEHGGYVVDVCANRKLNRRYSRALPTSTRRCCRRSATSRAAVPIPGTDSPDRAARTEPGGELAGAGGRSGVGDGVHGIAVRPSGAAAPDCFADPGHFRTRFPGADLPFHAGLY